MPIRLTPEQALEFISRPRPSHAERAQVGDGIRAKVPFDTLAEVPEASERRDALSLLRAQEADRESDLVPLRYQRMSSDPFAYLRGAAAVMASDLSLRPHTGIQVQLCGDAHLANFGMFASQERKLVFDINDFDETHPGPFEWDVKRLATSAAVSAKNSGFGAADQRAIAVTAAQSYRYWIEQFSSTPTLDLWFTPLQVEWVLGLLKKSEIKTALKKAIKKAKTKTVDSAVEKITEVVDGKRQFQNDPPLLTRMTGSERTSVVERLAPIYASYVSTMQLDRASLLTHYSFVDFAFKVVGVGSVGTRAYVLLLESGDGEPLILQAKQAGKSVLEPYLAESIFENHGERVVAGSRLMQTSGDAFLGWCRGNGDVQYDFYFRQLWDMKGGIDVTKLDVESQTVYAQICGAVLARAHARAGDPSLIGGYLGSTDGFDEAIGSYAMAYTAINDIDYQQLVDAKLG